MYRHDEERGVGLGIGRSPILPSVHPWVTAWLSATSVEYYQPTTRTEY